MVSLFYLYHIHRLSLVRVAKCALVFDASEIYGTQVDAADVLVPCGFEVVLQAGQIGGCRNLSCAWQTLRALALFVLDTDRNIEVVQDVECHSDSVESVVQNWSIG